MGSDGARLEFLLNGRTERIDLAAPHETLLDFLRARGLTGAKEGCAEGECGACTVLMNDAAVNSCLVLAVEADGQEVTTVEGLAADGQLTAVQQAFLEHGAVQCGFCIPGMLIAATSLLKANARPTTTEIQEALAGNLCRCAGYSRIIAAVHAAAAAARDNLRS